MQKLPRLKPVTPTIRIQDVSATAELNGEAGCRMNVHLKDHTRNQLIHIHAALRELKDLAEAERCDLLTHLLAMAYVESGDILRGLRPSRSGDKPLPAKEKIRRPPPSLHPTG